MRAVIRRSAAKKNFVLHENKAASLGSPLGVGSSRSTSSHFRLTHMPAATTLDDSQALVFYQDIYRFAYSLCLKGSDAQDLTQQTFMKYVTHGHTIQDKSKVRAWLFTTVHREFLHQRRRVVRFPHTSLEEAGAEQMAAEPVNAHGVDSAHVLQELEGMEENLRAPLTLFYLKDMRYREIAEVLDVPIGTVMSRLSRAKAALRDALGLDAPSAPELSPA
jgi:RNA polymerase sigma-70 factor, ECF subfamily